MAEDIINCVSRCARADPRGPEAEGACVPSIEKLWDALPYGHPPTCYLSSSTSDLPPDVKSLLSPSALSAGQGTGAINVDVLRGRASVLRTLTPT
jgi:hypothetical protein